MTANPIAESALRAVVAEARRRDPSATAVAVQAPGWNGRPTIALEGGEQLPVHWCRSVLELRQRLGEAADGPVVLVTDREERELGEDVLGYLCRGRLLRIGLWEPVKAHFKAARIAPRVVQAEWFSDALMRHMPAAGYPPAPSGLLTEQHALECLSAALLGYTAPTVLQLLEAVAEPRRATALELEPAPVLEALTRHHSARLGPVCQVLFAAARNGHGVHAVALGLAAQVAFAAADDVGGGREQTEAAVRLERYTGGARVTAAPGAAWGGAAAELVAEADPERTRTWCEDAQRLVEELGLGERAYLSDVLESGLTMRLERAAIALEGWLDEASAEPRGRALERLAEVERHRLTSPARARRLSMAARLVALVHSPEGPDAASLAEAARLHVDDGGSIDLAREALDEREPNERLRRVLEEVARRVDARRERRAARFAELLASATAADRDDGVLPVEHVLERVVAPVARAHPVLLVVLDGMSEAVLSSISPSLEAAGLRQVTPGGAARTPGLAALPSITRVSRASLLAGRLATGAQGVESSGFEAALHPVGGARLFHKAEVTEDAELRDAMADSSVRVVGVVVNAIDDLLDKGGQVSFEWTLERIGPLQALLDAAAAAGRAVVLASDHGHVLERGGEHRGASSGGARWRPAEGESAGHGEVALHGRRVLEGGGSLILTATEGLRYRARHAGYHGGATPQEMVAPTAVYLPLRIEVDGYEDAPPATPGWWELDQTADASPPAVVPGRRFARPPADQGELFTTEGPTKSARAAWIDALLASERYRVQSERAHRPPPDERVAAVLVELDSRGMVAPERAIAEALGVAPIRMRPLIASLQALLNVDGYRVLAIDPTTGDVRLDHPLLEAQFEL